ncbi:MAG: Hsp20/alpha crystallin family protein [Methanobacteriota archaeon]
MSKLYCRSIYDELNDMRTYLEQLSQQMAGNQWIPLLASTEDQPKMLPSMRGGLNVDVQEDEIIITVDIIEGFAKKDISINLINPQLLEISSEHKEERIAEKDGCSVTESRYGSMTHDIPLPLPVTEEGSKALFRNGILEIHLIKETRKPGTKIYIE